MNTEMNETPCDPQDDTSYTGQIATLKRELSAKSAECQRLRALVQDAYDDPDSEILGTEWNNAARAALQEVTP